jgi:1-acyl-sn-glycerol-3-phosphate acyltransferase
MTGRILTFIVSCYFWFTLFFISGIMFPFSFLIWLFTALFDRHLRAVHWFTCFWSTVILGINPYWKVHMSGKEKIDRRTTYVMMSNHQSGADILVLFKLFIRFKWVAKRELFKLPFIGWNMSLNRYISIERTRGRSKLAMMDRAAAAIRSGESVMIFPEGTRTRDGRLQPFKSGAFRLALDTGSPILPIVIKGTFHAIKKGGFSIHKNYGIEAVVLDPIPFETFRELEPKVIAARVYELVLAELERQ